MNSLNDEPKVEAITVVLLEDDAPTLWRLQDALTKAGIRLGPPARSRKPAPVSRKAHQSAADRSSTA